LQQLADEQKQHATLLAVIAVLLCVIAVTLIWTHLF